MPPQVVASPALVLETYGVACPSFCPVEAVSENVVSPYGRISTGVTLEASGVVSSSGSEVVVWTGMAASALAPVVVPVGGALVVRALVVVIVGGALVAKACLACGVIEASDGVPSLTATSDGSL